MSTRQAFFLPAGDGQRFCIFTPAHGPVEKGAILYLHPLAEELNKTRHLVAEQIRLLAAAGYSTLQVDLKGCGDSSHDFCEASWADWLEDVRLGIAWLQEKTSMPLWLWGVRAGALLAVEAGRQFDFFCNYLLWQPSASGEQALQQFLRLAAAAEWLGNVGGGAVERCKSQLAKGETIELAGYRLTPELAEGLRQAGLSPPPKAARLVWLDCSNSKNRPIFPFTVAMLAQWRESGFSVEHRLVTGLAFWQTADIASVPELLAATCEAMS